MRSPVSDFRTVCHRQCRFVTNQLVVREHPSRVSSTPLQYSLSQIDLTMHRRLRKLDIDDRDAESLDRLGWSAAGSLSSSPSSDDRLHFVVSSISEARR